MYIQNAEILSFSFIKERKKVQMAVKYQSRNNPENLTGMIRFEKNVLEDEQWFAETILIFNEENKRFESINFYGPTLIEELRNKIFNSLQVTHVA